MTDTPIDRAVFADLQDAMGADFVQELVTTFLDEAPGMLADLTNSATSGDADGFRRAAHSIKSNATIFGAAGLADLARQLELAGLDPDAAPTQIAALTAEYDRAATSLKDL